MIKFKKFVNFILNGLDIFWKIIWVMCAVTLLAITLIFVGVIWLVITLVDWIFSLKD